MTKEELLDFCKSDKRILYLLETDRAGEEVDSGRIYAHRQHLRVTGSKLSTTVGDV